MPKQRAAAAKGQKAVPVTTKFKLGGRKSTTSALSLTDDELIARLEKGGKDVTKIIAVLDSRGVQWATKAQRAAAEAASSASDEAEAA